MYRERREKREERRGASGTRKYKRVNAVAMLPTTN
jgi:hypothetical protein